MTVDEAMNLALAHHQAGRLPQAEELYRHVLATLPAHAGAMGLLGVLAHQVGRADAAIDLLSRSLQILPNPSGYSNLGEALRAAGRLDEAVAAYRQALALDPQMGTAHSNLGLALQKQRQFQESERALRQAVRLDPSSAAAWQNLCNTLGDLGKTRDAVEAGRRSVALVADSSTAWSDLGVACVEAADLPGAQDAFERAVALAPTQADARHNLAQVLLRTGQFARGWDEYEWRWACQDFPSNPRNFPQPLWTGQPLAGRTILLHAEQGLGDAIMFARYVPLVVERGPQRVIVECQPELVALIRTAAAGVEVIAKGMAIPPFDLHCPFLSLPRAFGTLVDTVPARVPYLRADPTKVAQWRERLAPTKELKVGIVWAGQPTHKNDHNRSTTLARFGRLALDGVRFYSLQLGPAAAEATAPPPGLNLVDLSGELTDYAQTAAVLANLDLVIAVDTSIVHAAAALARQVWVLLPLAGDWRWIGKREDSPWYPTMRLFRQERWGDWTEVMERVRGELKHRINDSMIR